MDGCELLALLPGTDAMDGTETGIPAERLTAVERFANDWVSGDRIPGATVSVFDLEGTAASAFGARDLRRNEPATPETLLGIGSCTKSITGVAVLQLAEAGELAVNDPVSNYVDAYEDSPGEPITVRELLTHSSGLPSDGMATALIGRMIGMESMAVPLSSAADFRRHVEGSLDERATHLDEPFFYYNSGFTILGEIIEELSGQPYAEYVTEHILDPLGMDNSTFYREDFEDEADTMTPYYKEDGDVMSGQFPFDESIHAPGGMLSSVTELAQYQYLTKCRQLTRLESSSLS